MLKLIALTVLALVGLTVAWGIVSGGPDKGLYVAQNELILESLPEVEGARLVRSEEYEYSDEDGFSSPDGWQTYRRHEPPAGMSPGDVVTYMRDEMSSEMEECYGDELGVRFLSDGASVSIGTLGEPDGDLYEILIDHDEKYRDCE